MWLKVLKKPSNWTVWWEFLVKLLFTRMRMNHRVPFNKIAAQLFQTMAVILLFYCLVWKQIGCDAFFLYQKVSIPDMLPVVYRNWKECFIMSFPFFKVIPTGTVLKVLFSRTIWGQLLILEVLFSWDQCFMLQNVLETEMRINTK